MHGTPWQPLVLLAVALFGALVLRLVAPFLGVALASFGLTSLILHYWDVAENRRSTRARQSRHQSDAP